MRNFFLILTLFGLWSCKKSPQPMVIEGNVFGSTFAIQYFGEEDYSNDIQQLFQAIDQSLSTYKKDSQISLWNAGNDSLRLSYYFIEIATDAQQVYQNSNGYYDPTVKTLVEGWGFGNGKANNELSPTQVDSLLQYVGYDKLKIDSKNKRITKPNPNIQLDFNSIAPGYTADKVSELLVEKGIQNFLVDIGGEMYAKGKNQKSNSPWKVGIEDPTKDVQHREVLKIVELQNQSLATSGNYRKIKKDHLGNTIVHTINPKTGMPQVSHLLSTTIITQKCAFADAYATATMAMGYPECVLWLKENKLKNYLIVEENSTLVTKEIQ